MQLISTSDTEKNCILDELEYIQMRDIPNIKEFLHYLSIFHASLCSAFSEALPLRGHGAGMRLRSGTNAPVQYHLTALKWDMLSSCVFNTSFANQALRVENSQVT